MTIFVMSDRKFEPTDRFVFLAYAAFIPVVVGLFVDTNYVLDLIRLPGLAIVSVVLVGCTVVSFATDLVGNARLLFD